MKVFILAGGPDMRWKIYFPYPKELALIAGEPLLARTVRQLGKKGIAPTIITHKAEIEQLFPDQCIRNKRYPQPTSTSIETVLDTQEFWEGRTVILLGDVLFSPESLDAILGEKATVVGYGRQGPQSLFAFTFIEHDRVIKAAEAVLAAAPRRCGMWELYRVLAGFSPHERRKFEKTVWRSVSKSSYTRDFDCLDNYALFLREHSWARSV